jgi:hypothetical protein
MFIDRHFGGDDLIKSQQWLLQDHAFYVLLQGCSKGGINSSDTLSPHEESCVNCTFSGLMITGVNFSPATSRGVPSFALGIWVVSLRHIVSLISD